MGYAVAIATFIPWLWESALALRDPSNPQPLAELCIAWKRVEPIGGALCRACYTQLLSSSIQNDWLGRQIAASQYEWGGNQVNLYKMWHMLQKEHAPYITQLVGTLQRDHVETNLGEILIQLKSNAKHATLNKLRTPAFFWRNGTFLIKLPQTKLWGAPSRNVKKLKPVSMSLLIVMFSPQTITGITDWGKWEPQSWALRGLMSLNPPVRKELQASLPSISVMHGEKINHYFCTTSQGKQ